MAEIWGYKWGAQYGKEVNYEGEWAEMLLSLSMQEIARGLEAERLSEEAWPSPIPVFRRNAEGGAFDFHKILTICTHWKEQSVLERMGLERTRECLFIMGIIGADIGTASTEQAEKLVRSGIKQLSEFLENGGVLPEFKVEIEHKPEPKQGFSLANFQALMEG